MAASPSAPVSVHGTPLDIPCKKSKSATSLSNETPAVPSKECLKVRVERESVCSPDLHLHNVEISFDDIEIDIDADMLNGIQVRKRGNVRVCSRYFASFCRISLRNV